MEGKNPSRDLAPASASLVYSYSGKSTSGDGEGRHYITHMREIKRLFRVYTYPPPPFFTDIFVNGEFLYTFLLGLIYSGLYLNEITYSRGTAGI